MDHMEEVRYMKNENVIKKNDFEKYEIIVPFKKIAGRRKVQFLCSELEKKHPCFSDEFTFDSVIKSFSRKGILQDVLVINKIKLAEYERKRSFSSFSGTGFCVENEASLSDCKNSSLVWKHRFFVNKKIKLLSAFITLFVLVIFLMSVFLSRREYLKLTLADNNIHEREDFIQPELNIEKKDKLTEDMENSDPVAISLFSKVSESNGKIKKFDWSIESRKGTAFEKMNAFVTGIFPENIEMFSVDAVIYENRIPQMNISYSKELKSRGNSHTEKNTEDTLIIAEKEKAKIIPNSDFNKSLRETLALYGAVLKEEKAPPYHITFIAEGEAVTDLTALLNDIAQLLLDADRKITSISINPIQENNLCFGITIENESAKNFDLKLLADYLNLFPFQLNRQIQIKKQEGKVVAPEVNSRTIGEIKKSDNTVVVFYKNEDGKINKKIKESEVE